VIPLHDDNSTQSIPIVTIALIAGCGVVFLVQVTAEPRGVAVFAHIGGFVAGMALINLSKHGV